MLPTPRQRFLDYVRQVPGARPVVSPFLPDPGVVEATLRHLGLPCARAEEVHQYARPRIPFRRIENEVRLARALDYEPMFMTDCAGLIFAWQTDEHRSDQHYHVSVIPTARGELVRRVHRTAGLHGDESGFPIRTKEDHERLVLVCESVGEREADIRAYYRAWRQTVGEDGVVVIGHPAASWLGHQMSPGLMWVHWQEYPEAYRRSMAAIREAALFVFGIALAEGIDFMSDCAYGLEMTSPGLFREMDLPFSQAYSAWAHAHGGLFWFHSCGLTRRLIMAGIYNELGADVIETIAPPPEGDNDLAESRHYLDRQICTKGNLSLRLLRDGSQAEVEDATRSLIGAVHGYRHIISTADAVLPETPPENLIAFVRTARHESE